MNAQTGTRPEPGRGQDLSRATPARPRSPPSAIERLIDDLDDAGRRRPRCRARRRRACRRAVRRTASTGPRPVRAARPPRRASPRRPTHRRDSGRDAALPDDRTRRASDRPDDQREPLREQLAQRRRVEREVALARRAEHGDADVRDPGVAVGRGALDLLGAGPGQQPGGVRRHGRARVRTLELRELPSRKRHPRAADDQRPGAQRGGGGEPRSRVPGQRPDQRRGTADAARRRRRDTRGDEVEVRLGLGVDGHGRRQLSARTLDRFDDRGRPGGPQPLERHDDPARRGEQAIRSLLGPVQEPGRRVAQVGVARVLGLVERNGPAAGDDQMLPVPRDPSGAGQRGHEDERELGAAGDRLDVGEVLLDHVGAERAVAAEDDPRAGQRGRGRRGGVPRDAPGAGRVERAAVREHMERNGRRRRPPLRSPRCSRRRRPVPGPASECPSDRRRALRAETHG